jgi:hypothetical protein
MNDLRQALREFSALQAELLRLRPRNPRLRRTIRCDISASTRTKASIPCLAFHYTPYHNMSPQEAVVIRSKLMAYAASNHGLAASIECNFAFHTQR